MSFTLQIKTADDVLADEKQAMLDELAKVRWQVMEGGITLPDGFEARTDREARSSLVEAVNTLQAGLMEGPIPWKSPNGWVDLGLFQLEAITGAVGAHVQACFGAERDVALLIDALEDPEGFDVKAAFDAALVARITA